MKPNAYFTPEEFDSPDQPGSGSELMKPSFIDKLTWARGLAGIPFKINSGYRTPSHNAQVGGSPNSAHMRGWAADISCKTSRDRHIILTALRKAGFDRIGIGRTFIHVDSDPSLPAKRTWHYYKS